MISISKDIATALLIIICLAWSFTCIIFIFKSIIDDRDIAIECTGSHLWEYVIYILISVIYSDILNLNMGFSYLSSETPDLNIFQPHASLKIASSMMTIISIIWGSVELWHNSCNNLTHTWLHTIGLIHVILNCILITIWIVRCLITLLLNWTLRETDGDADIEIINDKISTNV
jgi:hypothetical protein